MQHRKQLLCWIKMQSHIVKGIIDRLFTGSICQTGILKGTIYVQLRLDSILD
uniref:Uncharacterized protein n=1 Tax=Rhizophora mucronata TaxID=61149 RepID=A0A2P2PL19_RHIMU